MGLEEFVKELLAATDGGKFVILHFYPQAAAGFTGHPEHLFDCAVARGASGAWAVDDLRRPVETDLDMFALVSRRQDKGFFESVMWIVECFAPHLLREFDPKWLRIDEPWKVALRVMGRLAVPEKNRNLQAEKEE